jgi:hypothetical protein
MKLNTLIKIIAILTIITGICIIAALLLLAFNVEHLTPQELELTSTMLNLMVLECKIFIPIFALISCIGMFRSFIPKKTDDPIIRLVKTTGIMGGLLITLMTTLILR